jgi:hypothetical protein
MEIIKKQRIKSTLLQSVFIAVCFLPIILLITDHINLPLIEKIIISTVIITYITVMQAQIQFLSNDVNSLQKEIYNNYKSQQDNLNSNLDKIGRIMIVEKFMSEFQEQLKTYMEISPRQRVGQATFNCMTMFCPPIAEKIRGTSRGPFHKDEVLPDFYKWLENEILTNKDITIN